MLSFLKLDKLGKIQTEANEVLRLAILSDRGQNWHKMAENYKKLLKLISKSKLPASFVPPSSYNMLLYESFYHFGVALQNLGRHKESLLAYTGALNSMNLRKNGCMAGCNSNTCFQTPVLAKRGFAYAKSGDIRNAFKDIEKAVMLDSSNPDLYCLRALLWNMKKEQQRALDDLNTALKLNESHVGALLLRGGIDEPIQISFRLFQGISTNTKKQIHKDHQAAIRINSDASGFIDVGGLHHPKMIDFWNRFLRYLNIPRTVIRVDLLSAVIAQYNTTISMVEEPKGAVNTTKSTSATPIVENRSPPAVIPSTADAPLLARPKSMPTFPFRCGTPHDSESEQIAHVTRHRRLSYGQAVRTYTAKRQDSGVSEYIQRLVEHASRPNTAKNQASSERIPSIAHKPSSSSSHYRPSRSSSQKSSINLSRSSPTIIAPTPPTRLHAPTIHPPLMRRGSNISVSSCPVPLNRISAPGHRSGKKFLTVPEGTQRRSSVASSLPTHQNAAEFATMLHGIEVFKDVNIADAPRMYYKPWGGDKLPVAELPSRPNIEAFRV